MSIWTYKQEVSGAQHEQAAHRLSCIVASSAGSCKTLSGLSGDGIALAKLVSEWSRATGRLQTAAGVLLRRRLSPEAVERALRNAVASARSADGAGTRRPWGCIGSSPL